MKRTPPWHILASVLIAVIGCREAGRPVEPPLAASGAESEPAATAPVVAERIRALALAAGTVAEAELGAGETHVWELALAPGWFADLVVDQRGVDVRVSLAGPQGHPRYAVDSPNGDRGPEPLPLIAAADDPPRLEIESTSPHHGRYAVIVEELRPATARDRELVAAARAFAAGRALHKEPGENSLRQAVAMYRQAAATLAALGEHGRRGVVLYYLGLLHGDLGEGAAAVEVDREALSIFRRLDQVRMAGLTLNNLGVALGLVGEPAEAAEVYLQALEIDQSLGRRSAEGTTLHNLGLVYTALGKVEQALSCYEQALEIWLQLDRRESEGLTLQAMAHLDYRLGQREQAQRLVDRAYDLLEATGSRQAAVALGLRGRIAAESGRLADASEDLFRALRMSRDAEDRRQEAIILAELGEVHQRLQQPDAARDVYEQSLAISRELGDRHSEAAVLASLGLLESLFGQVDAAVENYRQALPLFAAIGNPSSEASALYGLAYAQRLRGDLPASLATIERALERIENLRAEPGSHQTRSSFLASKQDYYSFTVDLLMELDRDQPAAGYDARAFETNERARARSLLDLMAAAGADLRQGVDSELLRREAELIHRLSRAEQRRQWLLQEENPSSKPLAEVDEEVRRLLARDERLQAEIRHASSRASTPAGAQPSSLKKIQRELLDEDTLLLQYFLGKERSFVWAVTSSSFESIELSPRAAIETAALRAYALFASRNRTLARGQTGLLLTELSRLLLQPIGEALNRHRLLVVADGALYYVPFATLPGPGSAAGHPTPPPLITDHEILTLPSASLLAALRRTRVRHQAPGLSIAVLADPVYQRGDPRVTTPSDPRRATPAADGARDAESSDRLERLPYSRLEAQAILALFPASSRFGALDFEADRAVLDDLGRYRYLHFATHGRFDPDHPELSALALSSVDRQGGPRDGLFFAHEIYSMDLAADLVVLSACQTALGKPIRGEGLVGLTQAFLVAGARRVVVSLWQVDDQATAELMQLFYREMIVQGLPPTAALRRAQMALRQQKRWRDPFFWAGFVLHGDWRLSEPRSAAGPNQTGRARIYPE